jgi:MraZ protein
VAKFLGEFDCRIDGKGRVVFPAGLKKQLREDAGDTFILNRGFEQCLTLYTKKEWEKVSEEITNLNTYDAESRKFARIFYRGAIEISLDSAGRILIPKRLLEYSNIKNDVIFFGYTNKIEIWATEIYDQMLNIDDQEFSSLAQKVMGGKTDE